MEGKELTFFITYMDREALLTLSEFDTFGQLKLEIEENFAIDLSDHDVRGLFLRPENDNTILQVCFQSEFNCLQICKRSSRDEAMETGPPVFDFEIEAITRLKEKVPSSLNIRELNFDNAVSIIHDSADKKRALLLYLHSSNDQFCRNFLTYIYDEEIISVLDESFLVLGWDLEDSQLHDALTRALSPYDQLSFVSDLIPKKNGAAVCLIPSEDKELTVIFCLKRHVSLESLKHSVKMVHELCQEDSMACDDSESEIEVTKSLRRKLPANISVSLKHCTLDDALRIICSPAINERKALLLYLHNSVHPFSQMFTSNLASGELPQILNRSFFLLGWDLDDSKYHDTLIRALNRHPNLAVVSRCVSERKSVGLCILPVGTTISVHYCLQGNVSLSHALKYLKEVETAFKLEMKDELNLRQIEEETSTKSELGSEQLQTLWADMLGDRDYDSFEFDQLNLLEDKIAFALFGPPKEETGYSKDVQKEVKTMYDTLLRECEQIAEFKDRVEVAFVYVCLEPLPADKLKRAREYKKKKIEYNPKADVNAVPVFILRKCRGSVNPCRIVIDNNGRTYNSWQKFLNSNKYPPCEMIVPLDGRYQVVDGKVLLERHLSPATQWDYKFLQVGDIATGAAGMVSGAVLVTAAASIAAIPVAPVVIVGATVVGAASGIWALGRSIWILYDRSKHKESMSPANSEARGAYLNIVAGSLGFVGAGANVALTQLVSNGVNIGKGTTMTVNAIQVLNLSAGGVSLANSGYEVIDQWMNRKQPPSALTILQLGSSVLFFGHAVYNFKGAQNIVDETQARVLQEYQDSLRSNRHRKTFNRLMRETMNNHSDGTRAKAEVIAAIRNIPNKDEVFAALTRNTKRLTEAGMKYSADGGKITLGGIVVDMNEVIGLNHNQAETFFNNLSREAPTTRNVNQSSSTVGLKNVLSGMLRDLKIEEGSGVNVNQLVVLISNLFKFCCSDVRALVVRAVRQAINYVLEIALKPLIDDIDKIIPKNYQCYEFLRLGMSFFSKLVDEYEERYQMYVKTGDQKYYHVWFDKVNPEYAQRAVMFFEFIVRSSFNGESLSKNVLNEMSGYIAAWVMRKLDEFTQSVLRTNTLRSHSATYRPQKISCSCCGGYYYQSR